MMMMSSIEAVIFDMDGLLLDTEPISQLAWQMAGRELGLVIPPSISLQAIGRNAKGIKTLFRAKLEETFPIELFLEKANIYYGEMLREKPAPVKPGVFELLDYLEMEAIARGVGTSTRRELAEHKLASTGLAERFEFVVAGDEVENGKPAPDIFLRVAELLSIAPEKCLVLEDSEMGVRAAIAAGMIVFMIPDLIEPTPEIRRMADGIYESLPVLLEEIRNGKVNLADVAVEDSTI